MTEPLEPEDAEPVDLDDLAEDDLLGNDIHQEIPGDDDEPEGS